MNKTERQIYEYNKRELNDRVDQIFYEVMDEFRTQHKELAGKNTDIEFNDELNWREFIDKMDRIYKRRVSRVGNQNYKKTKNYKRWNQFIGLFNNVLRKNSNRRYKIALSNMVNPY